MKKIIAVVLLISLTIACSEDSNPTLPQNTAPSVSIISPKDVVEIREGNLLLFYVEGSAQTELSRMDLYINDLLTKSFLDSSVIFAYNFRSNVGTHKVKITAVDNNNNSSSDSVSVTVKSKSAVITNLIEFTNIPAGDFTFGENDANQNIDYNYDIMKYELTYGQYVAYLNEAYQNSEIIIYYDLVYGIDYNSDYSQEIYANPVELIYYYNTFEGEIEFANNTFSVANFLNDFPVTAVTYHGALGFAQHYGYSIPDELEWEKAARGNTGWDYPWGDVIDSTYANITTISTINDFLDYYKYNLFLPVGFFNGTLQGDFQSSNNASTYGVFDMIGNASEWIKMKTNRFYTKGFGCKRLLSFTNEVAAWRIFEPSFATGASTQTYYINYHRIGEHREYGEIGIRCIRKN